MNFTEDGTLKLLKALTEAHGVSGSEDAVRAVFRAEVKGEILADRMGGLFAPREGAAPSPRIMVAGHFDEVGFAVQSITAEGYLRLAMLGGVWSHTVLGSRLRILTGPGQEVTGIVSSKPIHYTSESERSEVVPVENLLVDVGADNAEEARQRFGIWVGQPVVPESEFRRLPGTDRVVAKALDNRVGVAVAMEIAAALGQTAHPNTVFCGATCQEEIRARGAGPAAHLLRPDLAIVLEGVPADDFPGSSPDNRQGAIGHGVQIRILDSSAIMNRRLNEFILSVAEALHLPHQVTVRRRGGTDASLINLSRDGVPVAVLGIPVRYAHTANGVMDLRDYTACRTLLLEVLRRLDESIFQDCVAF
jgi:putative aminopeptidase FrvX